MRPTLIGFLLVMATAGCSTFDASCRSCHRCKRCGHVATCSDEGVVVSKACSRDASNAEPTGIAGPNPSTRRRSTKSRTSASEPELISLPIKESVEGEIEGMDGTAPDLHLPAKLESRNLGSDSRPSSIASTQPTRDGNQIVEASYEAPARIDAPIEVGATRWKWNPNAGNPGAGNAGNPSVSGPCLGNPGMSGPCLGQDPGPPDMAKMARQSSPARNFAVRMVNSKRVLLNCEVKEVGPSGIADLELWSTRDGQKWTKSDAPLQSTPPFVVDVKEEGLYGFTLLARSGCGLSKDPPKPGDIPQIWVNVDQTRPVVNLLGTKVGSGAEARTLAIMWSATDKNLGAESINISYSERAEGPWVPVIEKVDNTGRYVWPMPPSLPSRFLIRVEATDMAGNSATCQSTSPVLVDIAQPVVSIMSVESASK